MNELVGTVALRLSSLLRGGLHQSRALEHLATQPGAEGETAHRICERIEAGLGESDAIAAEPGEAWNLLAATWHIAEASGAPLAPSLERMSEALSRLQTLSRRREVLLAGPKGSVMLIASLPFVAVIVGELLGVSSARQLISFPGVLLLVVGLLLLTVGIAWGLAMIRAVTTKDHAAGFEFDLLWIALAGGGSPDRARRIVVHNVDRFRAVWVNLDAFLEAGEATAALNLAHTSGISLRDLVALQSETLRENTHRDLERDAERLALKVLLPLGMFVLPAFICIGVIPLLLGMLS